MQAAAQRHGVAFRCVRLKGDKDDEASLREQRYHALERLADAAGAEWIATAHTADDQIETLILRLVRGAGRRGMSGIAPRRGRFVRPLLWARRAELEALLTVEGIGWCKDASNEELRYARNRVRHRVLPAIEEAFGDDCLRHLPVQARYWRREEAYLRAETHRHGAFVIRGAGSEAELDLAGLASTPAPLATRVIRLWFEQVSGGQVLSLRQLEQIERLTADRAGSSELRVGGLRLLREYGSLRVQTTQSTVPRDFAIPVDLSQPCRLDGPDRAWFVSVQPRPHGSARKAMNTFSEEVDLATTQIVPPLLLRPPRPGDALCAENRGVRRQVHEMMIDSKIPRRVRHSWPVLAMEGTSEVLWVPGVAVAQGLRGEPSGKCVRLVWRRTQK